MISLSQYTTLSDFDCRQDFAGLDLQSDHKQKLTLSYGSAMRDLIDAEQAMSPVAKKMEAWREQGRSRTAKDYAERKRLQAIVDEKQQIVDDLKKDLKVEDINIYCSRIAAHDLVTWEHKLLAEHKWANETYRSKESHCRMRSRSYGDRKGIYDEAAKSVGLLEAEGDMIMANARLEGFRAAMLCQRTDSGWRPLPGWRMDSQPTAEVRVYVRDHSEQELP